MKTDDTLQTRLIDNGARPATVTDLIASLRRRRRVDHPQTTLPDDPADIAREVAKGEDLVARFTRAATAVGMVVHAATVSDWLDVVSGVVRESQPQRVVIPTAGDGFVETERADELRRRLRADAITVKSDTDEETLFSADAAITGVVAAIAEHGSLVCESSLAVARGASLIPPLHLAMVAETQLLPDLCDYFELLSGRPEMPAGISLITGPSKTADIEGVLVTGVHGPAAVHVVLVRNA